MCFEIIPEKSEYSPGETVKGKVVLKTNEGEIKCHGIFLSLKGEASVQIDKEGIKKPKTSCCSRSVPKTISEEVIASHQKYCSSEEYVNLGNFLVGNGKDEMILRRESSYPFTFKLPSRLVSSFSRQLSSSVGKVVYYFELRIREHGQSMDMIITKVLPVHTHLDLTTVPEAEKPGEWEVSKDFGSSFCCVKTPRTLKMRVNIPSQGFFPGESIPFEVEMHNLSKKRIDEVSMNLVEVTTFHAEGHVRVESNVVPECRVTRGMLLPKVEKDVWRYQLIIPKDGKVFPTKLGGCGIIDLEYYLVATAHVHGSGGDLVARCKIIVGTCRSVQAKMSFKSGFVRVKVKSPYFQLRIARFIYSLLEPPGCVYGKSRFSYKLPFSQRFYS